MGKLPQNRVVLGDCLRGMQGLPDRSIDLVFADPPFNIGYNYDKYHDNRPADEYLGWSASWFKEVKRLLKPSGAFWLAIGDEYAAELKVMATRDLGFVCRSWVIWYYTFGVHCESKFTRSHAHLFHFVVDPKRFKFNDSEIRVPSARQLVYRDRRANPKGRVPDDTWIIQPAPDSSWILRPQDLQSGFSADSDTWYFPRVCGTFRERMGFHGCQMPEQLLARIIRACSDPGDLVFDPFVGSGTTLAVAKKLGRKYLGFELSKDYVRGARARIDQAHAGALIDCAAKTPLSDSEPTSSLGSGDRSQRSRSKKKVVALGDVEREILSAFDKIREGFSTDRVIADPELNSAFVDLLETRGVPGDATDWNLALLRMRKANRLRMHGKTKRTRLDAAMLDRCEVAAEIAWRQISDSHEVTLDSVLCSPALAQDFDQLASEVCPGFKALYYRWAALRIRKYRKHWQDAGRELDLPNLRFLANLNRVPNAPGLYGLCVDGDLKYVGDASDLRSWVHEARPAYDFSGVSNDSTVEIVYKAIDLTDSVVSQGLARKGAKSVAIARKRPSWNLADLAA